VIELAGERSDVARLRAISRDLRGAVREPSLGRALAKRVADKVFVEDQGRVVLHVGARVIPGTELRRKVLALLCFLLARSGLAATRDHVMEALWPDSDPEQALNSLHQTAYFLRRAFEQDYVEDLSPGYLHHEGDMVWLDAELVDSRSRRCAALLRALGAIPAPDDIDRLAIEYRGRFALDFAYEDWAATHRDSLHARYLEAMERALSDEIDRGNLDRAVRLAQRILEVDPDAEQVEVALLRLYRATGAHAAAAEQYAHYASVMREQLGVEPPTLEEL
jgi:DNA-binding SARP family transcriptional activator